MLTLTISIVTESNEKLILECLKSIYDTTRELDIEIYVVLNPTPDNSEEAIRKNFPEVKLIVNEKRMGFTHNHNMVMKQAKGKYILILNDDTLIFENTLKKMIDYMEISPDVGGLGCKILNADRSLQWSTGVSSNHKFEYFRAGMLYALMPFLPNLSCGLILEEGLPIATLEAVLETMARMAKEAGVAIVTGDTKVVEKGSVDGLYINTAGVGMIPDSVHIEPARVKPGMKVIVTGSVGDHAVAVMGSRFGLSLLEGIKTDCAPLNHMIHEVLSAVGDKVAVMRDPTRGGLATTLHEIAEQAQVGIRLDEASVLVHEEVQSVCGILGYDPLYLANEGKAVLIVEPDVEKTVLDILHKHEYGKEAVTIGDTLSGNVGKVGLRTVLGGVRLLEPLGEDQVPRIC